MQDSAPLRFIKELRCLVMIAYNKNGYLFKKKRCVVFSAGEARTKYPTFPTLLRCYKNDIKTGGMI